VPTVAPAKYPPAVRQLIRKGQSYEQYFNYSEAAEAYGRAIALLPNDPELLHMRADSYRANMQYPLALADYSKAIAILRHDNGNPFSISAFLRDRAEAYFRTKKYRESIDDDTMAIKVLPHNGGAFLDRARSYEQLGDIAQAIADYKSALPFAGLHTASACNHLGSLYLKTKQYKEAVDVFTHAIELQPDLSEGYYGRAKAYEKLGEITKAAGDTKKGHDLDLTY
jgi:tetratricopeptide (TPR) repeat protein